MADEQGNPVLAPENLSVVNNKGRNSETPTGQHVLLVPLVFCFCCVACNQPAQLDGVQADPLGCRNEVRLGSGWSTRTESGVQHGGSERWTGAEQVGRNGP